MPENLFQTLNSPLAPIPTGMEPRLTKLERIQAVVFDIYGTLVVSGTGDISIAQTIDKENELRSILDTAGIPVKPEVNLTKRFYDLIQTDHATSKAKGILYPEVEILEIWQRLFRGLQTDGLTNRIPGQKEISDIAIRFECAVNPVWPMPGMSELLQSLKNRGIKTGIVSNAQFYTPIMMESFTGKKLSDLGFTKDLCIWSYKEGLGKPSLALFEKLKRSLSNYGVAARNTLYLGNDMLNDIWTASQAGLRTALFAGDKRSLRLRDRDDRCKNLIPDAVLTALHQLENLL
jgi:putative hydrolase of the HAD superfamily